MSPKRDCDPKRVNSRVEASLAVAVPWYTESKDVLDQIARPIAVFSTRYLGYILLVLFNGSFVFIAFVLLLCDPMVFRSINTLNSDPRSHSSGRPGGSSG